MTATVKIS